MDLNSSVSLSPPSPPPAPCSWRQQLKQHAILLPEVLPAVLVLFHEASLCPSDQDKKVCNVLKTTLWLSTSQWVGAIHSNSQMRKRRPREAKGLVEPK